MKLLFAVLAISELPINRTGVQTMFEDQYLQALRLSDRYIDCALAERRRFQFYTVARRAREKGVVAHIDKPRYHLDRKIRHCYPRGPAFERMADLEFY